MQEERKAAEPHLCQNCGVHPVAMRNISHVIDGSKDFADQHLCDVCVQHLDPEMADVLDKLSSGKCEICGGKAMVVTGVPPNDHLYCFDCSESQYDTGI